MCWILNGKRKISLIIAARSRDKLLLSLSLRAHETSYLSRYLFALPEQATSLT